VKSPNSCISIFKGGRFDFMKSKKWIKVWAITVSIITFIGGFNYCIDPLSYNNKFLYQFNTYKFTSDERIQKFNLIKTKKYNTYIFGSSRESIIDPSLINKRLNTKAINAGFSGATIDEIEIYINYLVNNNFDIKYIFIPINLFSFGESYKSNAKMPRELIGSNESEYLEYFTLSMLKKSLLTIYKNRQLLNSDKDAIYFKKGMRYYERYLGLNEDNFENYIIANVAAPPPYWHVNKISDVRIEKLQNIYEMLETRNVKIFIFTSPLTYQQILKGTSFLTQLKLLDKIINKTDIEIYDFNNINDVNLNNSYFIDNFHFNYKVADCIVDKIITGNSQCGNNFGENINYKNIKKYKENIKNKYKILKQINSTGELNN